MKQEIVSNGELKPRARKIASLLAIFYAIGLAFLCFLPQPFTEVETPGIHYYGRLVVLLTPLNSLVNLGQLSSWHQLLWVFGQNVSNIFLLFPLLFLLLWLKPWLRKQRRVMLTSFLLSLSIELTQLLLDWLIAANRVFEVDDLWTNTLGGYLAFLCFKWLRRKMLGLK